MKKLTLLIIMILVAIPRFAFGDHKPICEHFSDWLDTSLSELIDLQREIHVLNKVSTAPELQDRFVSIEDRQELRRAIRSLHESRRVPTDGVSDLLRIRKRDLRRKFLELDAMRARYEKECSMSSSMRQSETFCDVVSGVYAPLVDQIDRLEQLKVRKESEIYSREREIANVALELNRTEILLTTLLALNVIPAIPAFGTKIVKGIRVVHARLYNLTLLHARKLVGRLGPGNKISPGTHFSRILKKINESDYMKLSTLNRGLPLGIAAAAITGLIVLVKTQYREPVRAKNALLRADLYTKETSLELILEELHVLRAIIESIGPEPIDEYHRCDREGV